jgi:hypothetical protein
VTLLAVFVLLVAAGTFDDDDRSVHEADIEALAQAGITQGCGPELFCPDDAVTRAQMASFLVRALDLPPGDGDTFADDDGSVHEADIEALVDGGVTGGCGEGRYCPDAVVTRGQMAAFLHRALPDLPLMTAPTDFTDTVGTEFIDDISWLSGTGITKGCNPPAGDRFCPDLAVTRAQMASFLVRALGLDPIDPEPDDWWVPLQGSSWDWYLQGGAVTGRGVDVYDVDLFETSASQVAVQKAEGAHVVCYLSAGTWEPYRPDADSYPAEILGNNWDEWDERYVDIRRLDLLGPILAARMDLCADKGFDAVEPDNIDTYWADTGFPLTEADELNFIRWLIDQAHDRGLGIAQKNVPELAGELGDEMDFIVTEDCFVDGWCDDVSAYLDAGKAVLAAEYADRTTTLDPYCPIALTNGVSLILKDRDLTDAVWKTCE